MRNKIAGIFLLLCLWLPVVVTMLWLLYQKELIRDEVKQQIASGLNKEMLITLKFQAEESYQLLKWEHSREFKYNNQKYDVVNSENRGDSVFFLCWKDEKETGIENRIEELLIKAMGKDPVSREKQQKLTKFYQSLFCSGKFEWKPFDRNSEILTYSVTITYYSDISPPPGPPPKSV
ncbi:MAG: hypothetical protein JW833_00435 [Prolixibacteraceae bacterium]|nr:hypothetical protein [Prolixibacteraceae bacterium]